MELAYAVEPVQTARLGPLIYQLKGTPFEYKAGRDLALPSAGSRICVKIRVQRCLLELDDPERCSNKAAPKKEMEQQWPRKQRGLSVASIRRRT